MNSNRSELLFVVANPGSEAYFPKRSRPGAPRRVQQVVVFSRELIERNPDTGAVLATKDDLALVRMTLRDAEGRELLKDAPVSPFVQGLSPQRAARKLAGLRIDPDKCSVTVTLPVKIQVAVQFQYLE
ncbi:MAG: hypothetical protein N2483_02680 [Burkholderiaceae bacterium]|nr:hypothetical protein [Burkholderiaceae bacterium]